MSEGNLSEEILELMDNDPIFNGTDCYWETEPYVESTKGLARPVTEKELWQNRVRLERDTLEFRKGLLAALITKSKTKSAEDDTLWAVNLIKKGKWSLLPQVFRDLKTKPFRKLCFTLCKDIAASSLTLFFLRIKQRFINSRANFSC